MKVMIFLSVQRVFFNEIASGAQKYEERQNNEYYRKLFSEKHDCIVLHCGGPERIVCDIGKIELVRNPYPAGKYSFLPTDEIWRIELVNPVEFSNPRQATAHIQKNRSLRSL